MTLMAPLQAKWELVPPAFVAGARSVAQTARGAQARQAVVPALAAVERDAPAATAALPRVPVPARRRVPRPARRAHRAADGGDQSENFVCGVDVAVIRVELFLAAHEAAPDKGVRLAKATDALIRTLKAKGKPAANSR